MANSRRGVAAERVVIALLLLVALAVGAYKLSRCLPAGQGSALPVPRPRAGNQGPFDYGWQVKPLDGERIDMAAMKGKVLFVNFWEHWCGPCRAEMPAIQDLYDKLRGSGVEVLPVFVEDPDATRAFVEGLGLTMPLYQAVPLPASLAPRFIPTTLIVARDGTIVYRHKGSAQWGAPAVVEFLRGLAGAESADDQPAP